MNETKILSAWVAETPYEALPQEVVETVRIYILDNIASGFAGARTPWASMVADMARESSHGSSSVFGRDWTTSASAASLINGVAIGGFETDGPFSAGNCHPSGAVFPALLAAAEQAHIDGKEFLTATALAYEALCHVGVAATRAVEDVRGYHGPGTNAPIGGAFGAGRAMGFSAEMMTNAVGIATSHGGGLLEFFREGAMTKRLHLGRGSQLGLESALLAQRGFTGPSTAIEGEHGFLNVYSPSPKPELLLKDLGTSWLLMGITLKAYPCHISFHSVVDAITRFRQSHDFAVQDIDVIGVRSTARMMEDRFAARAPTTLMGAQYSMPWSAAHALCHDAANPATWTDAALHDPRVNQLAASMLLREESPSEPGASAEVFIEINGDQDVIAASDWKGAPSNPYSYEDMTRKLQRYAVGIIPDTRIAEISERVAQLESQEDIAALAALIRS